MKTDDVRLVEFGARFYDAVQAATIPGNQTIADSIAEEVIVKYRGLLAEYDRLAEEVRVLKVQRTERRKDYRRSLQEITTNMNKLLAEATAKLTPNLDPCPHCGATEAPHDITCPSLCRGSTQ